MRDTKRLNLSKKHPQKWLRLLLSVILSLQFILIYSEPACAISFSKSIWGFDLLESTGIVQEKYRVNKDFVKDQPRWIVLIEDEYAYDESSNNTSAIIKKLVANYGIRHVFVEGGAGNVSLRYLKNTANKDLFSKVLKKYAKKGILTGGELSNLESGKPFVLWGVENQRLYEKFILDYGSYLRQRELLLENLEKINYVTEQLIKSLRANQRNTKKDLLKVKENITLLKDIFHSTTPLTNDSKVKNLHLIYTESIVKKVNDYIQFLGKGKWDEFVVDAHFYKTLSSFNQYKANLNQRRVEFLHRIEDKMHLDDIYKAAFVVGHNNIKSIKESFKESHVSFLHVKPAAHRTLSNKNSIPKKPLLTQALFDVHNNELPVVTDLSAELGLRASKRTEKVLSLLSKMHSPYMEIELDLTSESLGIKNEGFLDILFKPFTGFLHVIGKIYSTIFESPKEVVNNQSGNIKIVNETASKNDIIIREAYVEKGIFKTQEQSHRRVENFLVKNVTHGKMPLSYRAPKDYWLSDGVSFKDPVDGIIERQIVTYSVNIYDASTWQIALTLLDSVRHKSLVDSFTYRLLSGRSGGLAQIRAYKKPFFYGDEKIQLDQDNAFFFRTISEQYIQPDPLDGKFRYKNFPNNEILHHEDWKPIMGEQAWATLIGPLQVAYIRGRGKVSMDSPEMQLALSLLPAFEAMMSPIGGVYHAPHGTDGKDPRDISNENNISLLAGLRILLKILELNHEYKLADRVWRLIRKQEEYFKNFTFNKEEFIFHQGGFYIDGEFRPTKMLAVDCQTWTIMVLGPEWIDNNFGEGTSYRIWRETKKRGGYFNDEGLFMGVGFTDDKRIFSVEWTLGAMFATQIMSEYYRDKHPNWSKDLLNDTNLMRHGIESLRVKVDEESDAYLYAHERYNIPFGWWANPIPSLVSSTWAIMYDYNFNPFELGGGEKYNLV